MTSQTGISFITTLTKQNAGGDRDSRCVGYLVNKERAIEAVKENAGDIHEAGSYPLCVVETLGEGIYPDTISTEWFEWNQDKGGYQQIADRPEDLKNLVCFSIG